MNRPKVLIADDYLGWQVNLVRVLEPYYQVLGLVARGDEVVAAALDTQPDVIILDLLMPGKSGLSVLPELKAALPNAAVVIVTAVQATPYMDEAYRLGADGYVLKARAFTDLVPAVQNAAVRISGNRQLRA